MKKLAILINSMNGGGAERVVSILLEELVHKYEVFLIVLHAGVAYKIPSKVKLYNLSSASLSASNFSKTMYLPFLGCKYYFFCKKNKIDISLSFLNRANYINIISKCIGAGHRTIISERATTTEEYPLNSLKGKISRALIKWLYPKADSIIAISKGIATDLSQVFNINSKKITTIYNPIDSLSFSEDHSNVKNENSEFTFIAVGRLDKSKNFQLLLRSFSRLDETKAKLIILGDGPLRDSLMADIKMLKIEDRVWMPGSVSDIYTYLKKADCFVMSSKFEGFGNVIIEALRCGKAVISTDCKYGPSEILDEKISPVISDDKFYFAKYGILVPLNNIVEFTCAMKEMIVNDAKRKEYENIGPNRVKNFNMNVIFPQYFNVLEN